MHDTLIIGDGPGGLSAALYLAKKNQRVIVFGQNKTPMHEAMLYNYLGINEMTGSDFQEKCHKQVLRHGAEIRHEQVTALSSTKHGFMATNENDENHEAKYLILAMGKTIKPHFASALGLELNDRKLIDADRDGRTDVENVYAIGWSTRPDKVQAIISAGDGAAAALDILSKEAGKPVRDFDKTP